MNNSDNSLSYSSSGVDYETLDPAKKLSQLEAKKTTLNLTEKGFKEIEQSRGETAFVWDMGDFYMASVLECLGSKNLVADEVRKFTGKTHYDAIAQDTVAAVVNDLVAVGASPLVVNAYFSLGDAKWLEDKQRTEDLIHGWAGACNLAGATWGGGETPSIKGVTYPDKINLAGSAVGIIKPKERLTLGDKLESGDSIILIESNGIHANGISLARAVAEKLPEGYKSQMENGESFGKELLKPSYIYAKLVSRLFEEGVDIHYMVNITGHGFRKIMRANKNFTYQINLLPKVQEEFKFIQEKSNLSDSEMYGTFNMGAGFAIFVPKDQAQKVVQIAASGIGFQALDAGEVMDGEKKVILKEKNITYSSESLGVR